MNYTDLIYQTNFKEHKLVKWYICGVKKRKGKTYIVAKSNKRNKNKFITINIAPYQIDREFFAEREDAEYALLNNNKRKEYIIEYKCGHEDTVRLKGTTQDIKNRIKELEQLLCPNCRNKKSIEEGCIPVEMPYSEYKKKYRHCDTKVGSYKDDGKNKTIIVYIKQ